MLGRSTLADTLAAMLDDGIDAVGAHMGNIQILDRAGNLRMTVSRGFGAEFLQFFDVVHPGAAACGTALHETRRVAVHEVARSAIFANAPSLGVMQRASALACLSTPLVDANGRVVGMFNTHWRRPFEAGVREFVELDPVIARVNEFVSQGKDNRRLDHAPLRNGTTRRRFFFGLRPDAGAKRPQ